VNKDYVNRYSDIGMKMNAIQRRAFNKFNEYVYFNRIKLEIIEECFCSGKDFSLLSRYDRFGLPFGTQVCKKCGLITQNIRISEASMELFYNEIYWDLISGKSRKIEFSTPPKTDDASAFILQVLKESDFERLRIFEVGCGSGDRIFQLANMLNLKGVHTESFGCDYSDNALFIAESKGIRTVKGGFSEIAQYGKADVLILSHLFEHLTDLNLALSQIDGLCHENTIIYVELPGIIDLNNKKEYMYNYQDYNVLAHTYNFSLTTLSFVFATKNFALVHGNEFVRAVFRKSPIDKVIIDVSDSYNQVVKALAIAKDKDVIFQRKLNRPYVRYLKNIVKAILNQSSC